MTGSVQTGILEFEEREHTDRLGSLTNGND